MVHHSSSPISEYPGYLAMSVNVSVSVLRRDWCEKESPLLRHCCVIIAASIPFLIQ